MLINLFLKGSLIGFSVSMPIGPVGMLCIQHSLRKGLLMGLMAGLGAALADALYGCLAGCGVSMFSQVIQRYHLWLQVISGCMLCYIGIKMFCSSPHLSTPSNESYHYFQVFWSSFAQTLTNPLTLLGFTAIYTSFGITLNEGWSSMMTLSLGILLGAGIWWMMLVFGIILIGKKFPMLNSPIFNRISGSFLAICGLLAISSAVKDLLFPTLSLFN